MAQTMVIKRLGVFSVAKIYALINAVFGLIFGLIGGVFFAIFTAAMSGASGGSSRDVPVLGAGIGFLAAIILYPVIFGILGFVVGATGAAIYNLASRFVGGIEIDTETNSAGYGAPQYPPPSY
jgi:hypothetical protein